MRQHGCDITSYKDKENHDNSLLHTAVKLQKQPLIEFLNEEGFDLDV